MFAITFDFLRVGLIRDTIEGSNCKGIIQQEKGQHPPPSSDSTFPVYSRYVLAIHQASFFLHAVSRRMPKASRQSSSIDSSVFSKFHPL